LPDYFIDKANQNGIFNGRIVVVKSTSKGATDAFYQQDGLYTTCIRGLENGKKTDETIINSSISRVLSAKEDWSTILKCAHDPNMQIILSNTTEVGIVLMEDDIHLSPPRSFPGKLLGFLVERFKTFSGSNESGMIIIPTELITDNGTKLRSIVIELAKMNTLDEAFIHWLQTANHFCNSLVDRIVPGQLEAHDKIITEKKLGFTDDLMIMAESFRLWAIETGDQKVVDTLSFSKADDGIVISPDIEKFRELKLRLLNGTHSFCCGLAMLAGFDTVKDTMNDGPMEAFARRLMELEIATAMTSSNIPYDEACTFADKVMNRFRNPYLNHKWSSIAVNYTSKMRMRNISLLEGYYHIKGTVPEHMALGFAAYLLFMKCREIKGGYYNEINGQTNLIEDEAASWFADNWASNDTDKMVDLALANKDLWGADLSELNGLAQAIKENISLLQKEGVMSAINSRQPRKTIA
ncbi:MAG: tagaturonate reductase, partial [Bacteroidota bacterium]